MELCPYWSGDGAVCPCAVLGLQPPVTERCDTTDLLVNQCACPVHLGGDVDDRPEVVGQPFEAQYAGTCVQCDHRITIGDLIVRLAEDPKSYVHSGRCP